MTPPRETDVDSVEARFERLKDEFLSAVGHELRTPLTAVQGTLKLLQGGVVDPSSDKGRRLISLAVANGDRLEKMVQGLLDVNRLKSGHSVLVKEQCDLQTLVRAAAARAESETRGHTIRVDHESGLLWADPQRLGEVLDKLLGNAIRYSPDGSEVVLSVRHQGNNVLFAVQDHGVGLSPDDAERIFTDFGQLDQSDTRQTGGTGLSLAICRHIVRQHGGRIWVESQPGQGACFYLLLPAPQEQVLIDNANSFRAWVDHVRDAFWLASLQHGRLMYMSRAVLDITGRPPETFYAPGAWADIVHPDDAALAEPLMEGSPRPRSEYRIKRPDGSVRWVQDRRYTVRDEFGARESVVGIVEDITEQRQTMEELELVNQELERRVFQRGSEFAAIFKCSPEAVLFTDPERSIRMVNPAFTRLLGYRPEAIMGKTFSILNGARTTPWKEPIGSAATTMEDSYPHQDGSMIPVEVMVNRVFGLDASNLGYLVILRDLRLRHRLEGQVRQSERIAAIGLLADGVAHDFNNLLTVVGGNTALLQELAGDPGEVLLREIAHAVERGTALTGQLLSFSQPAGEPEILDVNAVVEQSRLLLRCVAGEHFEIQVERSSAPAWVRTELFQLQQMLVQLVVNAREVMPAGGNVSIRITHTVVRQALVTDSGELPPGSYVLVSVNDNGSGMEAEAIHRMFEPFFTTRNGRRALGLSTVNRIALDLGGGVAVQSEPGRGTTFHIYLPGLDRLSPASAVQVGGERRPTILVVEDDPAVRRLVSRVLLREGYHTVEAVDGQDGVDTLRGTAIDLLITDIVMPKLSGEDLAAQLRRLQPEARILFMSGHREPGMQALGAHFIAKPLVIPQFVAKVRELMGPE
ncbi:MAG TPA: ATP-binding protein [Candidatus Xenobia bacterium]|jgi:PAS domain S-box-containing protein